MQSVGDQGGGVGRQWKAVEGVGRRWKALEGVGSFSCLADGGVEQEEHPEEEIGDLWLLEQSDGRWPAAGRRVWRKDAPERKIDVAIGS